MAALIGARGSSTIVASAAKGWRTYGRAFVMYAIMMTCSGLAHTVVPSSTNQIFNFWITYMDLLLTSSIAFHFGLAALVDIGLDETGLIGRLIFVLGEVSLAALWYYFGYLHPTGLAFWYLYFGVTVVCCGFYVLTQIVILVRNRFRGFTWLATAASAGAIGLYCMLNRDLMCKRFGANFGGSFWWDAFSNIAMVSLVGYFLTSRDLPTLSPATEEEFDLERQPEEEEEHQSESLPPTYHDVIAPEAGAAHPQVVYIPLQMYPVSRD